MKFIIQVSGGGLVRMYSCGPVVEWLECMPADCDGPVVRQCAC